ncbi:heterogeneous nuclear ribonucleoprotein U-like protein 1 [Helianthus annuus]|uniref:heterogeneous nuclear ribonucleoprotein U-like protein 1 n=1 Tax=Helianthus annuus TaxID=4232 RepID=UPI000B8FCE07|nr:heterogeneous nuclear ribonucleoprotein U-like protein 1 [Helianthus annuus]
MLTNPLPNPGWFSNSFAGYQPNTTHADWDTARTMLNDEKIRVEARQQQQSSVLAAASVPSNAPSQPHPSTNPTYYSNRGRGCGRGQGFRSYRGGRGRGGGTRPSQSNTYNQNNPTHFSNTYPPWAWWNIPPCPYPTQPNYRPNNPPQNPPAPNTPSAHYATQYPPPGFDPFNAAAYGPNDQQTGPPQVSSEPQPGPAASQPAHASIAQGFYNPAGSAQEFDALNPSDLGAAFTTMVLNEPEPTWTMDTGATEHLTTHQGPYNWRPPFAP